MAAWQVAAGHNNAAGFADMTQDPAAPGRVQYGETRYAADGSVARHGYAYYDLEWNHILATDYATLIAQFGITNAAPSATVTVEIRDEDESWIQRNATAILLSKGERVPNQPARRDGVVIRLMKLETTS